MKALCEFPSTNKFRTFLERFVSRITFQIEFYRNHLHELCNTQSDTAKRSNASSQRRYCVALEISLNDERMKKNAFCPYLDPYILLI